MIEKNCKKIKTTTFRSCILRALFLLLPMAYGEHASVSLDLFNKEISSLDTQHRQEPESHDVRAAYWSQMHTRKEISTYVGDRRVAIILTGKLRMYGEHHLAMFSSSASGQSDIAAILKIYVFEAGLSHIIAAQDVTCML
jgi:hypothetical protein